MTVRVTITYACGGCSATVTAPEQVIRSEFASLSGQSHGFGCQVHDEVRVFSAAPEGWVPFDPYTGCCYCPACWALIITEDRPLCTRCEHPITTTPVVDPDDRSERKYCSDNCRTSDAEAAGEQWYPSGVAT